jgi:hypothetical protein
MTVYIDNCCGCAAPSDIYSFGEVSLATSCTPSAGTMVSLAGTAYSSVLANSFGSPPSPGFDVGFNCGPPLSPTQHHGLLHYPASMSCGPPVVVFSKSWLQADCTGFPYVLFYGPTGNPGIKGVFGGVALAPSAFGCGSCAGPPWAQGIITKIITNLPMCVSRRSWQNTSELDNSPTVYSCALVYPTSGAIVLPLSPLTFTPSAHLVGTTDNSSYSFYGDVAWFAPCYDCACP